MEGLYKTYIHQLIDEISDAKFLRQIYSLLVIHISKAANK